MKTIPLLPGVSQIVSTALNGQYCLITIRGNYFGVFVDLSINDIDIKHGAIALNNVPMFTDTYLGFNGQLMIQDTQGNDDPVITEIGSRFKLRYLESGIDF